MKLIHVISILMTFVALSYAAEGKPLSEEQKQVIIAIEHMRGLSGEDYAKERDALVARITIEDLKDLSEKLSWDLNPQQLAILPTSIHSLPVRWWVEVLLFRKTSHDKVVIVETYWNQLGRHHPTYMYAHATNARHKEQPPIEDISADSWQWLNPLEYSGYYTRAIQVSLGSTALPLLVELQFNRPPAKGVGGDAANVLPDEDFPVALTVMADQRCAPVIALMTTPSQGLVTPLPSKVRMRIMALHRLTDLVNGLPAYVLEPKLDDWQDAEPIKKLAVRREFPAVPPLQGDAFNAAVRTFINAFKDPHPGVRVAAACEMIRIQRPLPQFAIDAMKIASDPAQESLPWARAWFLVTLMSLGDASLKTWVEETAKNDPDKDVATAVASPNRLRSRNAGAPLPELVPFGASTLVPEEKK